MQTTIEATNAAIMTVREADNPVNNGRQIGTIPGLSGPGTVQL